MIEILRRLWLPLLASGASCLLGLGWGLPSIERAQGVLSPEQRHDEFYRALEENRRRMYQRIGPNIQAAYGRGSWSGTLLPPKEGFEIVRYPALEAPPETLLHGYSSFLLRSVEQDEQFVLNALSRLRPWKLEFNPHAFLYGGAYLYPLAAFLGSLHAAGCLRLDPDPLFYYRNPQELAKLYMAGRLISALAALGCVVLVFQIARRLYGERVGWWSALLFGLSPALIANAHVMKPHLPGTLWALACLLCCLEAAQGGAAKPLLRAGAFMGLAVGSVKYFWILAFPLSLACFLAPAGARPENVLRRIPSLLGLGLLAVGVFFLTNPYVLLDWRDFIDETRGFTRWYQSGRHPAAPLQLLLHPMRVGLGTPAWILGLAGLLFAARRRSPSDRLLLLFLLPMLLATALQMSSAAASPVTARVFLAGLALLLIPGVAWALNAAAAKPPPRSAFVLLVLALAANLASAALYDANFIADRPGRANSFKAARWIEESVPAGQAIGFGTPAPMVDRFPPIRFSRYELVYFAGPLSMLDERLLPRYYVINALSARGLPEEFLRVYELRKTFDAMSIGGFAFRDVFTPANFPVALFVKKKP